MAQCTCTCNCDSCYYESMLTCFICSIFFEKGSKLDQMKQVDSYAIPYSPCKRPPPLFDDPVVHVYLRYTYKWLVYVRAHPRFWPVNFKRPWALTREYSTSMTESLTFRYSSLPVSRYLLLPALMGDLTLQVMEGERTETIRRAKVYCLDYLQRCKTYTITSEVSILSSGSM